MSDRVAVMNAGRLVQLGTADDLYDRPANAFVATFVGETNRLTGRIASVVGQSARIATPEGVFVAANPAGLAVGEQAHLFLRPERLHVLAQDETRANMLTGRLIRRDMEGAFSTLMIDTGQSHMTVHRVNGSGVPLPEGPLRLGFSQEAPVLLPLGEMAND